LLKPGNFQADKHIHHGVTGGQVAYDLTYQIIHRVGTTGVWVLIGNGPMPGAVTNFLRFVISRRRERGGCIGGNGHIEIEPAAFDLLLTFR
jgi:hypothetical protein